MAYYLVRANLREELRDELAEKLAAKAFINLRPFGRALTLGLEGARLQPDEIPSEDVAKLNYRYMKVYGQYGYSKLDSSCYFDHAAPRGAISLIGTAVRSDGRCAPQWWQLGSGLTLLPGSGALGRRFPQRRQLGNPLPARILAYGLDINIGEIAVKHCRTLHCQGRRTVIFLLPDHTTIGLEARTF